MKLADLSTGPDWVVYVGFIIFAVLSIVLISGHGSWLISGYNTASKEEKAKYNEKNSYLKPADFSAGLIKSFSKRPAIFRGQTARLQDLWRAKAQCLRQYRENIC